MKRRTVFLTAAALAATLGLGLSADRLSADHHLAGEQTGVLVFSKTAGYRHASIEAGVEAFKKLAEQHGWTLEHSEDSSLFTPENLAKYKVVVFLNTTGDILNEEQEKAFENFVESGGGFVGIHSAADTEYDWEWYGRVVGAYFKSHPPGVRESTYIVENRTHPTTRMLPETWTHTEENYTYRANPRERVFVLMSVDEDSYNPGDRHAMGDHPMAWYRFQGKGRCFFNNMGHMAECYSEPMYLEHIAAAVEWAAGKGDDHGLASAN